ncbi:hypothetical protein Tco_0711423 [Tanacetum coccineum]
MAEVNALFDIKRLFSQLRHKLCPSHLCNIFSRRERQFSKEFQRHVKSSNEDFLYLWRERLPTYTWNVPVALHEPKGMRGKPIFGSDLDYETELEHQRSDLVEITDLTCVFFIHFQKLLVPTVRIVLNKEKQIWKPKGKLSDNSLSKTQRVWKATGKLFADIGYQWRPTGKKLTLGKLDCGSQWRPTGKKFALGEICQLTKLSVKCRTGHALVSGLRLLKTYDGESFKAHEFCGKVHRVSQIWG